MDHLGDVFPTPSAMCRHWHVNPSTLRNRLSAGWDLRRALATPAARSRPVTDALGRSFPSVRAACEANGVSRATFRRRLSQGLSEPDALMPTAFGGHARPKVPVVDADGIVYGTVAEACARHGVSRATYIRRRAQGMTPAQALAPTRKYDVHVLRPLSRGDGIAMPDGTRFGSVRAACESLGVPVSTYCYRRAAGDAPERALRPAYVPVIDHLGTVHPSTAAMIRAWGVGERTYYLRVAAGLDMRQRLEGPDLTHRPSAIFVSPFPIDPDGVTYDSVKAMCDAWGVSQGTFLTRLKLDWPLLDALSREPLRGVPLGRVVVGPDGDEHPSLNALCRAWGVVPWQVERELSRDPSRSVAEALLAAIDRYGTLF